MAKLDTLLLLGLLASCLMLVKTAYESRRLYAALDTARLEQQQLDADHKRLDAEAQAQGTHLRVERTARERLSMRTATPAVTAYVSDPGPATAPTAAAANGVPAPASGASAAEALPADAAGGAAATSADADADASAPAVPAAASVASAASAPPAAAARAAVPPAAKAATREPAR